MTMTTDPPTTTTHEPTAPTPAAFTPSKLRMLVKATPRSALFVSDVNGALWASDSYWAAPVCYVAPLLTHYNLEPKVGTYDVGTTVTRSREDSPNIASIVERADGAESAPLTPVLVGGQQSYILWSKDRHPVAAFTTASGTVIGIRDDFLRLLAGADWATRSDVTLTQDIDKHLAPVNVTQETTRSYTCQNPWRTETTINVSRAIVMPCKIAQ